MLDLRGPEAHATRFWICDDEPAPDDSPVPLFDTAIIHAEAAAALALET